MSIKNQDFVTFENVQKTYDGKELVVKNLNLNIYRGEFLTMLGPSGSGKTTCLMMLAGRIQQMGKLNNGAINNIPPYKEYWYGFQNYLYFHIVCR